MNKKKKIIAIIIVVAISMLNICGKHITYALISKAFLPYKGVVVVLDAGHGGRDKGAEYGEAIEKDINLLIVEKIKDKLEDLGMKVILTRKDSNDLAQNSVNRKKEDMKNRVNIINDEKVDFFISVHLNAYANDNVKGMQIFYRKQDSDSLVFAKAIQNALETMDARLFEIKEGDYYLLNESNKIGVLLECGFLSNPEERDKLMSKQYQEEIATSIQRGIINFMKEVYE